MTSASDLCLLSIESERNSTAYVLLRGGSVVAVAQYADSANALEKIRRYFGEPDVAYSVKASQLTAAVEAMAE